MDFLKLEEQCSNCNGTKYADIKIGDMHAKSLCSVCSGLGVVPTKEGKELLLFIKKHTKEEENNSCVPGSGCC